uniref:FAR1 DNA-binding domain n=1 Tax=Schistocephalus solidus TaxID=70667 RepID=A0A0X3PFV3_SCHSO
MDVSAVFSAFFQSACFKNQDEFNEALRMFEKRVSRQYHPEGTVQRALFDFKHAQFACTKRGNSSRRTGQRMFGTNCSARFTVSSSSGSIRIVKFDMMHNHDAEEVSHDAHMLLTDAEGVIDSEMLDSLVGGRDGVVIADFTPELLDMFQSASFSSFIELQDRVNEFMRITGSVYVMRNTVRLPGNYPNAEKLVYKSVAFECQHFGTYASYATIRCNQRTGKFGCRSKIYFYCRDHHLTLGKYEAKHNHGLNPNMDRPPPKSRRPHLKKASGIKNKANNGHDFEIVELDVCAETEISQKATDDCGFGDDFIDDYSEAWHSRQIKPRHSIGLTQELGSSPPPLISQQGPLLSGQVRLSSVTPAVMVAQIEPCLQNLKLLALSSGVGRFQACMDELLAIEMRWRREFGAEEINIPMGAAYDLSSNNLLSPLDNSSPYQTKRKRRSLYVKNPSWEYPSSELPSSSLFDPPPDIPRNSWFCD